MIAELFIHPQVLPFNTIMWLLLPLCASVAIVYKTLRVDDLRRLFPQAALLIGLMLAGLCALGASLWAIQEFWP